MRCDIQGKVIRDAITRREEGVVTLEITFTDGTCFAYQVQLVPNENGRLFDSDGELLREWE